MVHYEVLLGMQGICVRSWWGRYRGDVAGGLTAAIVALPLALAFGIASGAGL